MARLTYLEIVNKVLKKLREDTVGSVDYSTYSSLIGEFVNDAKRVVEDSWNWSHLRRNVRFTSTGTNSYDLGEDSVLSVTGTLTNERSRLVLDDCGSAMAFDTTTDDETQLTEVSVETMTKWDNLEVFTTNEIKPQHFALSGRPGPGYTVLFDGYPNGRSYNFFFFTPQDDLEEGSDTLLVPWHPVVQLALLYALDERGEEIGEPGSKAWMRYEASLSDAISLDSFKDSHKITFKVN